jgi:hypothetical protein
LRGISTPSLLQWRAVVPSVVDELLSHSLQALSLSGSPEPLFVRFVDLIHILSVGLRVDSREPL